MERKIHTTNYFNTFIEVAPDTKATCGTIPPSREQRTVAEIQYNLISKCPYKYSSDDVLFLVFAEKNGLAQSEYEQQRKLFFSKGIPCLRTSPLTKSYGFGIHCNKEGKVAIYGIETEEYHNFLKDDKIQKVKAVRSTRK